VRRGSKRSATRHICARCGVRGDAPEGASRAHGPNRPRRPSGTSVFRACRANGYSSTNRSARAREGAIVRRVDRHERRQRGAREGPQDSRTSEGRGGGGGGAADIRRPRRAVAELESACPPSARSRRGRRRVRRGRRLMDPRARHVGGGAGAPPLEDARKLVGGLFWRSSHRSRRGREEDPLSSSATAAILDDRKMTPRELEQGRERSARDPRVPSRPREGDREGDRAKKGRESPSTSPWRGRTAHRRGAERGRRAVAANVTGRNLETRPRGSATGS